MVELASELVSIFGAGEKPQHSFSTWLYDEGFNEGQFVHVHARPVQRRLRHSNSDQAVSESRLSATNGGRVMIGFSEVRVRG